MLTNCFIANRFRLGAGNVKRRSENNRCVRQQNKVQSKRMIVLQIALIFSDSDKRLPTIDVITQTNTHTHTHAHNDIKLNSLQRGFAKWRMLLWKIYNCCANISFNHFGCKQEKISDTKVHVWLFLYIFTHASQWLT